MEMESCVPPGFRFHPTEEELVGYYLKRKMNSLKIDLEVIVDVDLYKIEPWDIQAKCKLGYDEQNEWYFFSHKDRKYPTGTRTNRATATGFWKATGRDKAIVSKNRIIGMRKTLVFYKGRASNGRKTDWIMHEYRLQTSKHGPPQEEGWVVCRAFKKPIPNQRAGYEAWNHTYYATNTSNVRPLPNSFSEIVTATNPNQTSNYSQPFGSEPDLFSAHTFMEKSSHQLVDLPQLDSPTTLSTSFTANEDCDEAKSNSSAQYLNWKNLDGLLTSQVNNPIQNFQSFPQNYELATQSHFLDYFPES